MALGKFSIKKEENLGLISLILGIISLPLIIIPPLSIIICFFGFTLGLIYIIKNFGFGWDSAKKKALIGAIISLISITINIVLFTIGVIYIGNFG